MSNDRSTALRDRRFAGVELQSWRAAAYRLLEPSRHGDRASLLVDIALVALIVMNVGAVLAASVEPLRAQFAYQFHAFELFSVGIFTAEYLCRVWCSVEAPNRAGAGSTGLVRLKFMARPAALIDLAAILPFYLATFGLLGLSDMRVVRLLRLLRLLKLSRYSEPLNLLGEVLKENARNFVAAFGVLIIVMILAASGMYVLEREVQPIAFGSIPASMWWAFATLTTVGYGDVTPITPLGKAFGAAVTVVSIGIVALPAGMLASSFSARLRQKSNSYRYLADRAAADGVVTVQERVMLERRRKALGIGQDLADSILEEEMDLGAPGARDQHCPSCGRALPPDQ